MLVISQAPMLVSLPLAWGLGFSALDLSKKVGGSRRRSQAGCRP